MGVSTSGSGRGVSGGLASVEMSDSASEGVSKPDEEVDLGRAECRCRWGVAAPADDEAAAPRREDIDDIRLEGLMTDESR